MEPLRNDLSHRPLGGRHDSPNIFLARRVAQPLGGALGCCQHHADTRDLGQCPELNIHGLGRTGQEEGLFAKSSEQIWRMRRKHSHKSLSARRQF